MILGKSRFCLGAAYLGLLLVVGACSTKTDTCDLSSYKSFQGASLAAVTLPADPNIRIIMVGDVVTMDFNPQRVNLRIDAKGRISDLGCG